MSSIARKLALLLAVYPFIVSGIAHANGGAGQDNGVSVNDLPADQITLNNGQVLHRAEVRTVPSQDKLSFGSWTQVIYRDDPVTALSGSCTVIYTTGTPGKVGTIAEAYSYVSVSAGCSSNVTWTNELKFNRTGAQWLRSQAPKQQTTVVGTTNDILMTSQCLGTTPTNWRNEIVSASITDHVLACAR